MREVERCCPGVGTFCNPPEGWLWVEVWYMGDEMWCGRLEEWDNRKRGVRPRERFYGVSRAGRGENMGKVEFDHVNGYTECHGLEGETT